MTHPIPPAPTPPAGTRPASLRRPWWKAAWALLGAGAIVGLVIGLGAGASGKPEAQPGPTVTQHATQTITAHATTTATPTVIRTVATRVKTRTVTYTPPVKVAFSDGTFRVGSEIRPGTYHTDGTGDGLGCYYERDARGDGLDSIIANDNISGPTTIDISSSDYAFKSSGGCDWSRVR